MDPKFFFTWHVSVVEQGSDSAPQMAGAQAAPPGVTNAATPAPPLPTTRLTEDQARAVVLITGDNAEGTGFLIKTPDGPFVVTNLHVIGDNPNLKITTNTGALVKMISAKAASDRDLAMLSIQDAGYNYLEFSTDISKTVQTGDQVITPGNSQGGEVMLNTSGKVLGIGPERIEFDNPIYHGNSGGPVFHVNSGKVLGVVTEAIKVDLSNSLDKTSFANRQSAISSTMRYFGLRLDTVTEWIPIDWTRFQTETTFLELFNKQSRSLDSFLNPPSKDSTDASSPDANLYLDDKKIVAARDSFRQQASGTDGAQKVEAFKELLFDLNDVADTDMPAIQNMENFYPFDRPRARDEIAYRKALKSELDDIGNDVSRLNGLTTNNN
jgi:V8-like Glu-specific endopeptidase